jgi:hypothetical protein
MHPFWSPDSRSIGFFAGGKLKRVDVDGGPVLTLCDAPVHPQRGAWNSNGVILFSIDRVYRVADTGGVPQPVTELDTSHSEIRHFVMGFLSDGHRFIFGARTRPGTIFVTSLDSPTNRQTLEIGAPADSRGIADVSLTPGFLLYANRGTIVARPFDEDRLQFTGPPTTLADGGWSFPSASRTRVVLFRTRGYAVTQLTWRGRDGSLLGVVGPPDTYLEVELSPTNRRAAVVRAGPWVWDQDVWLTDLSSGSFSQVTAYRGLESDPHWSPDERRLAFTSDQGGAWAPFMKDLVTGKEERLVDAKENTPVDDWTRDGRFLLVRSMRRGLYALPMSGEHKLQLLSESAESLDQSQVSPNGEWVAFNTSEVFVARFPSLTDRRQVSTAGGAQPRWRRDGRELYYVAADGTLMAIGVTRDGQFPFLPARPLFKTLLASRGLSPDLSQYDVSADGKRFLILEPKREPAEVFTFLVNWTQGLKN